MTDQGPIDLRTEEQAVVKFKDADGRLHDTLEAAQRATAVSMLAGEMTDARNHPVYADDVAEWILAESAFVRRVLDAVDRIKSGGSR